MTGPMWVMWAFFILACALGLVASYGWHFCATELQRMRQKEQRLTHALRTIANHGSFGAVTAQRALEEWRR